MHQVISNLLENAIKFTRESGTITITADVSTKKLEIEGRERGNEEEGEEVVLVKVRDSGSGIDTHILPRLFTKLATSSSGVIRLGYAYLRI
ncbi:MAG: ATP-binding protein [Nitrososphaeraceae archaeon]